MHGPVDGPEIRDVPERWQTVGSTEHFKGHVFHVRTDRVLMPDGSGRHGGTEPVSRDVVAHPGSVGVVALDGKDRVLLVRQYRHPVGFLLWEIPAGLRDVEDEPVLETARRELAEETGYRAAQWHTLLDTFTSPGMTDERSRIFLARGVSEVPPEERDFERVHEEAEMIVEWVPLDEAVARALRGDISNMLAQAGVLAAQAARADGFRGLRPADAPER